MRTRETASRIPWRAVVLGAAITPPLTLFGMYAYIIVQTCTWMGEAMLRGPVFLLFLLTLATLGMRRLRARWALRSEELLLIYSMTSLGTACCGVAWVMFVVPAMSGSPVFYAEHGQPTWALWLKHIPPWFMVQDPITRRHLWEGYSTLYTAEHLRALLVPGLTWTVLMLLLAAALQGLMQWVRQQWIERERLTFPLTYLPLEMTRFGGSPPFWKNRLMWAGFLTAAAIETLNSINYLHPAVPRLPVKVTPLPVPANAPWSGLGSLWVAFYPFVIGIGFLLSLDISLSLWFFFLFTRLQNILAVAFGWMDSGGWEGGGFPYHLPQNAGAFLVFGLMLLGRCRRGGGKWELGVLAAALGGILAFCSLAGIPLWIAAAYSALYLLYATVVARLVAEAGTPSAMAPISPQEVIFAWTGSDVLTRPQKVAYAWLRMFDERFYDNLAIHQLTAMKLLPDRRDSRGLHLALAVAAVVGILGGFWALYHIYFQYGLGSAKVREWPSRSVARIPFLTLQQWIEMPQGRDLPTLLAMGVGAAVMAGLVALRQRVLWWPIHPIGYAMAGNWSMQELWCPFLVAWLLKGLVLRYGGMGFYRRVLPYFLGLILGDYIVPLLWAIAGVITGQQMYLAYPH